MPGTAEDLIANVRGIVNEHYARNASPLLLSELGGRLRRQNLWPAQGSEGRSLRQLIETAGNSDLFIVRDKNSPAYVAVVTADTKHIVEQWIERRVKAVLTIPDLEALPRAVILAFCVQADAGQPVFLRKVPPFRYETNLPDDSERDQFILVDDRYRRPGLKISELSELHVSDRLDLQTRIAAWSKDKNVPIESFYKPPSKKHANALERLLAAQPPGMAEKIVIPGDIALLLSRQD